jgi:hypothetical protein
MLVVSLAMAGCWTKPSTPAPVPTPKRLDGGLVAPAGSSAEICARAIIEAQLAAARGATYDDHAALAATFAPDAVVIASDDIATGEDYVGRQLQGNGGEPGTVKRLIADGNSRVVWFDAELTMHGISGDYTIRAVELAAADADWKVVAAGITPLREFYPTHSQRAIAHPTAAGPLTDLMLAGPRTALATGPAEADLAIGTAATTSVIENFTSRHPTLGASVPREVVRADYGFVQLGADIGQGKSHSHALGQLFALPTPDHGWRVVLVQYISE